MGESIIGHVPSVENSANICTKVVRGTTGGPAESPTQVKTTLDNWYSCADVVG
jgi:hypothetical protein